MRTALWIVPLLTLMVEQVVIRIVASVDAHVAWVPWVGATAEGILGEMDTIITLSISLLVFTLGSVLVTIQVAGGQLTPRIIATTLLRDNLIRFTVGLFAFTMFFAVGVKARSDDRILHIGGTLAVFLGIGSTMAFLFLIDYTARMLRPVAIVWRIGEQGIKVIRSVYPETVELPLIPTPTRLPFGSPARVVVHRGKSGVVLAVNLAALVVAARDADGVIECVHRVGNFVAAGEPLFHLYGGAAALGDRRLRAQVAFGAERTIEQDSTFAFRVIADVALKALSKAINDPTTAVLALDQLHRLLRIVGQRHLHDDSLHDAEGQLRLIFPTPGWEDFVQLACREIRLYGAENFQVARRMRAMIDNLMVILPARRHRALQLELDLLKRALAKLHDYPEDLALACQPDLQGLGGGSPLSAQEQWERGDRHP
ncbi:MAG: DUF2254 domain-containing protein [Acetobacteraceae bacterium]